MAEFRRAGKAKMEENKSYHLRSLTLAAAGSIILSVFLTLLVQHAQPLEKRNASPGFGWSWDFDYESAMRDPRPIPNDEIGRAASFPMGHLVLPLNQKIAVAGLEIIYRGVAGAGKFRLDIIIPLLDPTFAYSHELSEKEARKEFRLVDEHFKVTAIGPRTLAVQHLSP
jgi:hypothetical protein